MKTPIKENVAAVASTSLVRHPLILPKRARWFYAESQEQEEWEGPFKTLEEALYDAVQQREECAPRMNGTEPIWVGHGTRTRKSEREDWGSTFDFFVDSTAAVQICLPNSFIRTPAYPNGMFWLRRACGQVGTGTCWLSMFSSN
jgi:hypothetical protein